MTEQAQSLPHWDVSVVYPSLQSPEFAQGFQALAQAVAELAALFDAQQIGARAPAPLDPATVQSFDTVIDRLNTVLRAAHTLQAYISAFVSTNSRDTLAQARQSEYQQLRVKLTQLHTRFTAWVGSLDVQALIAASPLAAEHAHPLRRLRIEAQHLMSPPEEALSTELAITGSTAWIKLWSDVSSQLQVPFERGGRRLTLPMSGLRNLAQEPDRDLRRRAYEAELAAWQGAAVPLAAAMNGVKGEVIALTRRRGWESPLDAALFANGIDRATLEAMLGAAHESLPVFHRYLRAKARALGVETLAWYDLFAPLSAGAQPWQFGQAAEFIVSQFATYSTKMSEMAARAFRERWIDAEPRSGKVDGAFCMLLRDEQSRVLANYQPAFHSVLTLAHELGHAYHNLNLAGRAPLQRRTPMVFAETASTFCETIVRQASLQHAERSEQIAILEDELQGATQVVVDITSRFLFEQSVFAKRVQRELAVDELNGLMLQAQRDTYGDGLDPALLHPYMWAAKPHYYRSDVQFYNYPYMFGLLFGLGMYARYQADPTAFRAGYDELLSATGLTDAVTLGQRFGIDIRSAGFWRASLGVIAADVERYEELVRGA